MRIIFFGTPEFAVPSLRALVESGHDIASAVCQPDRLKGRGHKLLPPPVKEYALSENIPVLQPQTVRSGSFPTELSLLKPDVIAVVAYGRIIPPPVLKLPSFGCINVHASLLPKYRGAAPVQWAIINGDTKTGVTTMMMDEGLDTGDILLMEETEIGDADNAQTLGAKLSEIGASLLVRTLGLLGSGSIRPVPQSGTPTFAPPLKKEDGRIEWSLPAKKIFDLIRGTYPWPGAYCSLKGERIVVLKAATGGPEAAGPPGRVVGPVGEGVAVSTGIGSLLLLEVKPEGKKMMSAASFMRGRRLEKGASFDV